MANDPRATIKHPDPARPDDPLIPQPGDTYAGHPDPAYPSDDHPAQQQAEQSATSEAAVQRQMTAGEGGEKIEPPSDVEPLRRQQQSQRPSGWQDPSDQKQLTDKRQQQLTDKRSSQRRQQSAEDSSNRAQSPGGLGDPSPGDENPRIIQPAKPQRS